MKSFILFLVLATSIIAIVESQQDFRVDLLPEGFRFLYKHAPGIIGVVINGQLYRKGNDDESFASYEGRLSLNNGWWVYQNLTTLLNPGDSTVFALVNRIEEGNTDDLDDAVIDQYVIPDNATRVSV